jgi:hypothetical protein
MADAPYKRRHLYAPLPYPSHCCHPRDLTALFDGEKEEGVGGKREKGVEERRWATTGATRGRRSQGRRHRLPPRVDSTLPLVYTASTLHGLATLPPRAHSETQLAALHPWGMPQFRHRPHHDISSLKTARAGPCSIARLHAHLHARTTRPRFGDLGR